MGALLPVSASIRRGSEWRLGQPARRLNEIPFQADLTAELFVAFYPSLSYIVPPVFSTQLMNDNRSRKVVSVFLSCIHMNVRPYDERRKQGRTSSSDGLPAGWYSERSAKPDRSSPQRSPSVRAEHDHFVRNHHALSAN